MVPAPALDVRFRRSGFPALVVLIAVLGTAVAPAFAGLAHPMCASKQHDCGRTPAFTKCCCGDEQSSAAQSSPVQSRTELRVDLSPMPAATSAVHVALTPHARIAVHTSPPDRGLVDLPTLFATLLI
jgi:hypothetical protein